MMDSPLKGKKILLGVTGGIAAYKAVYLLRLLKKAGAEVQVLMTEAACNFVAPLTFEALSEKKVHVHMFSGSMGSDAGPPVEHIALSRWPDFAVVAPATANTIAKLAQGRADDLISAVILAYRGKVILAPAMNDKMWESEALRENLGKLSDRGYGVISPGKGDLACGSEGEGRMAEPEEIFKFISGLFSGVCRGLQVLVSAGRTEEDIDPVRFISNRSTGKMGFALAESARDKGAEVTVVSGRFSVARPEGVRLIEVRTGEEMGRALKKEFPHTDVLIMAAAVADYGVKEQACKKQKGDSWTLELTRTEDILSSLSKMKKHQFIIGFALETDDLEKYAMEKLAKKKCDLIVANNPLENGAGFGKGTNSVTIFSRKGKVLASGVKPKSEIADLILEVAGREEAWNDLIAKRNRGKTR